MRKVHTRKLTTAPFPAFVCDFFLIFSNYSNNHQATKIWIYLLHIVKECVVYNKHIPIYFHFSVKLVWEHARLVVFTFYSYLLPQSNIMYHVIQCNNSKYNFIFFFTLFYLLRNILLIKIKCNEISACLTKIFIYSQRKSI